MVSDVMVLTLDDHDTAWRHGAIAIKGHEIVAVGRDPELRAGFRAGRTIDGRGKLALPGLINAHSHMAMSTMRGITHDVPDVLYNIMWPLEKALRQEDIYDLAMLGAVESLKAGTTCLVDHYFFMEEIARACVDAGIRGMLGHTVMSADGPFTGEGELEAAFAFVEKWKGRHPLVTPFFAPHAADTVRPEWLRELAEAAGREALGLHLHVAQSEREVAVLKERYHKTPVQLLAETGILGPRTLAAHCILLGPGDAGLLAQSGTTAVFCPTVHGCGGKVCRAAGLVAQGVRVGLGSDCASCNDDMNMFEELRMAVVVQNAIEAAPGAIRTRQALRMATRVNAQALGLAGRLGQIAPGFYADLVLLDVTAPRWTPMVNVEANLVFCSSERDVDTVFVGGRPVVEGGRLTMVDETKVVARAEATLRRIFERASLAQPRFVQSLPRTRFADETQPNTQNMGTATS